MISFAGGLVVGCVIGVFGSLFFLLFASAIPDGFHDPHASRPSTWQFSAIIAALMMMSVLLFLFLKPHRFAFLALVLLFLVLITAEVRGTLASMATLAFAAALMSYILPPSNTIWIAAGEDRLLLALFIGFGVVGSRLVGRRESF